MKAFFVFCVMAAALLFPHEVHAHGMRTAYVEVVEHQPGQAMVRFRTSVASSAKPVFPPECTATAATPDKQSMPGTSPASLMKDASTYIVHCNGAWAGRELSIQGLGTEVSEAIVWISQHDGSTSTHLVSPAEPRFHVPAASTLGATLLNYVPLGAKHIAQGADHLLFLLLLVLLLEKPKPVLIAETAFTISHGLSFSAAALGWIHVSKEATEACIALSLLFLALDVDRRDKRAPSSAHVALLALVFGLVHGLGFAGGLTELGMPDKYAGWALLGFGLGVELGQVACLALALVASHFLFRGRFSLQSRIVLTYAAGALAAYWFLDRARDCISTTT